MGTAHVSEASAAQVSALIAAKKPDQVLVELCVGRARGLLQGPEDKPPPGLLELAAGALSAAGAGGAAGAGIGAYGAVLQSMGMDPGQDMREAMRSAARLEVPAP